MEGAQKVNIVGEPNVHALTGVNTLFDEEQFVLMLTSGNQVRRYLATPKHAKRILLLLQQQIAEYEKQWGELVTELPKAASNSTGKNSIGFNQGVQDVQKEESNQQ